VSAPPTPPESAQSTPGQETTPPADALSWSLKPLDPSQPLDGSQPPDPSQPPAGRQPRRVRRLLTLAVLIVLGLAGVAGGGVALSHELTRNATKAEVTAAVNQEIASRWRRLQAGKIFPAKISYVDTQGDNATVTLLGIAPPASCRAALMPGTFQLIRSLGCSTMLRATYVNPAGTYAATVGIGVMPSTAAAGSAFTAIAPLKPAEGLNVVGFSGTITNSFGNADRGAVGINGSSGPYVFLYSVGYTDGVPGNAAQGNEDLATLGQGVLASVENVMTSHANPCSMKDIRC
jgi:hypothetical protein